MSFPYQVHDLKQQPKGATVHVRLKGNAANVRLLDTSNYSKYKRGRDHRAYGGLVKRSQTSLKIPRTGHWYVVVDLIGLGGKVASGVTVEPPPMRPYRESRTAGLASVIENAVEAGPDSAPEFDVFISHASEDKDEVVRPLARALMQNGISVWYDEFELRVGDSREAQELARPLAVAGAVLLSAVTLLCAYLALVFYSVLCEYDEGRPWELIAQLVLAFAAVVAVPIMVRFIALRRYEDAGYAFVGGLLLDGAAAVLVFGVLTCG